MNWYDFGARMQDMQTGKWLQIDPYATKYTGISPFAFCGNNTPNTIDPDGRQLTFNVRRDENNEITGVNITLTGKIVARDGITSAGRNSKLVNNFNSQIEKIWGQNVGGNASVSFTSNLTLASENNPVQESDHVIYVDRYLPEELKDMNAAAAVNEYGGKVMYTTRQSNDIGHEAGHWMGLLHPISYKDYFGFLFKNPNIEDKTVNSLFPSNVMHWPNAAGIKETDNLNKIQFRQIKMAIDASESGLLNHGSNGYDVNQINTTNVPSFRNLIKSYVNENP